MKCERCNETPGFHSFESVGEVGGTQLFYCFPAQNAKSVRTKDDMLQFVSHFPTENPWSLIFHVRGYTMSHMMPLSLAIEMATILQRDHAQTLQKIYVVEGDWFMRFLFVCIFPLLSSRVREKFVVLNGSLLEVVTQLRGEGISLSQLQRVRDHFGKIE